MANSIAGGDLFLDGHMVGRASFPSVPLVSGDTFSITTTMTTDGLLDYAALPAEPTITTFGDPITSGTITIGGNYTFGDSPFSITSGITTVRVASKNIIVFIRSYGDINIQCEFDMTNYEQNVLNFLRRIIMEEFLGLQVYSYTSRDIAYRLQELVNVTLRNGSYYVTGG